MRVTHVRRDREMGSAEWKSPMRRDYFPGADATVEASDDGCLVRVGWGECNDPQTFHCGRFYVGVPASITTLATWSR